MTDSAAVVDEYAGVISNLLHGGGVSSLATELPHEYRDLLHKTAIEVHDAPTPEMMRLAGTPKGSLLLGLYTFPPPTIRIFAIAIAQTGHSPTDVFEHELGHRFGFDHSVHGVHTALFTPPSGGHLHCTSYHPEIADPLATPAPDDPVKFTGKETCPFCRLHSRTAEAMALSAGLRKRAWLAAQPSTLPIGLGGTIPLMRGKLIEARAALVEASAHWPDRRGEVRDLDRLLQEAQVKLQGHLTTEDVTPAAEAIHRAWDASYSLTHAYFLGVMHPGFHAHDLNDVL